MPENREQMHARRTVTNAIRKATRNYVQRRGQDLWFNPFDISKSIAQASGYKSRTPKSMKNVTRNTVVVEGDGLSYYITYGQVTDTLNQAWTEGVIHAREIDQTLMPWYQGWEDNVYILSVDDPWTVER